MPEISAVAARRLSRLRTDFLSRSPEDQLAFVEKEIRGRRYYQKPLKGVNSRARKKEAKAPVEEVQIPEPLEVEESLSKEEVVREAAAAFAIAVIDALTRG